MRVQVAYTTTYRYSLSAGGVVQALRLTPGQHDGQHILNWRVDGDVDGAMRSSVDAVGNHVQMFYADGRIDHISRAVVGDSAPRVRTVRWRTVANTLSIGFDVRR